MNDPIGGFSKYQSSQLASGEAAAFCVVLACVSIRPAKVGEPPARSVAPSIFSRRTKTVSPVTTENTAVIIGLAALEVRVENFPNEWATFS